MACSKPPRIAMWLLKHCASANYRDSLAGDLIEQLARGRTRAWCWRQVIVALGLAPLSVLQRAPWMAAGNPLFMFMYANLLMYIWTT